MANPFALSEMTTQSRPEGRPAARAAREAFLFDVVSGLSRPNKSLNSKYFYDDEGSRLFERITRLPDYYLTRTETRVIARAVDAIGELCRDVRMVVEFGAGSGQRTELLLGALPNARSYVPVDVSQARLDSAVEAVESTHPHIRGRSMVADFTDGLQLPAPVPATLGLLLGSTIGNFPPSAAAELLSNARMVLGREAWMLVGVDLVKPWRILRRAYDDSQAVTAAFNKNVLARINRELGGNFELRDFGHEVCFDAARSRVEMHLVSLTKQEVAIGDELCIRFRAGESIHTESSYKYTVDGFAELAQRAGWKPVGCWVDEDRLFSVHLLQSPVHDALFRFSRRGAANVRF